MTILDFLKYHCRGRQGAVTGAKLAEVFGRDKRSIQQEIERLRSEGYPILSADQEPRGYFYPSSADEADECYRSMRNRAIRTFETLGNIKTGLEREFGNQLKLSDFGW